MVRSDGPRLTLVFKRWARVPQEIRDYLLKWREEASALVLRYASEKLPKEMRVLKTK